MHFIIGEFYIKTSKQVELFKLLTSDQLDLQSFNHRFYATGHHTFDIYRVIKLNGQKKIHNYPITDTFSEKGNNNQQSNHKANSCKKYH